MSILTNIKRFGFAAFLASALWVMGGSTAQAQSFGYGGGFGSGYGYGGGIAYSGGAYGRGISNFGRGFSNSGRSFSTSGRNFGSVGRNYGSVSSRFGTGYRGGRGYSALRYSPSYARSSRLPYGY